MRIGPLEWVWGSPEMLPNGLHNGCLKTRPTVHNGAHSLPPLILPPCKRLCTPRTVVQGRPHGRARPYGSGAVVPAALLASEVSQ
jgi:hypothetical protein